MHVEYTAVKLRGAKYKGDKAAKLKLGAELELRREPGNVYDSNAVLVLGEVDGYESVPLGYLPKGVASKVAPQMDAGRVFSVIYAGDDIAHYLMILATENRDELKLTRMRHR